MTAPATTPAATGAIDPVTFELIKNAIESLVDEMALTIVRTAYSGNLKNSMDLSSAFCNPAGETVAQGLTLPLHLGSIPDAMAAIFARYRGNIDDGDVFLLNDPFEGGSHLPDMYVFKPVFHGGRLLGWVATIAHHTDVGGKSPGGNSCDATEIYQEGLRLPPIKLYEGGRPVQAVFDIIERNVRIPVHVLGDLQSQLAACTIGERGLRQLVAKYGFDTLQAEFTQLLDVAERLAREEIRAMPDGRYSFTDYMDDDGFDPGPIPIAVTVTVEGDQMTVDFTGSSPQVKGAINASLSFTKSAVYACARSLMDPAIPNNEGYFRPITIKVPLGSVINPLPPAPVAARGLTGFRLANAVMGALAQVRPDLVPAAESGGDTGITIGGYYEDRRAFVFLEFLLASWGGRPDRDGVDGCASLVVNFSNNPIEVIEAEYPLRIEEYGFVPDTGGAGQYRGGLGLVREYTFLEREAVLQIRSDHRIHRPYGLAGGHPGAPSGSILNPQAEARELGEKVTLQIKRGDRLRHYLAGAGGWGDPRRRDPWRVREDVLDGKVTPAAARDVYGVVLRGPRLDVDEEATAALRGDGRA